MNNDKATPSLPATHDDIGDLTGLSPSSLSREPLTSTQQNVQSQAFDLQIAVNPIVAAAGPLLTIATQLSEQSQTPKLKPLHKQLCHEVKALESKLQRQHYPTQTILAARYFLCALIDEIILHTEWGENGQWQDQSLLRTFQKDNEGGESFFLILERIAEDPKQYIDLLELGYLCLSLGFQGKYRHHTRDHQTLGMLIDNLYYLIQDQRGEFSKQLSLASTSSEKPPKRKLYIPWYLIVLFGAAALTAVYIPYHLRLKKMEQHIEQMLQPIEQIEQGPNTP